MRKNTMRRVVTGGVGLLITVGVVGSLMRYLLPHDLHMAVATPLYGGYAPEQLPVLAAHPAVEAAHRLGGALYLVLGALQWSARLRARRPEIHRWCGRVFLALSVVAAGSGILMVVRFPYEAGERAPAVIFGVLLLIFALKGLVHIRRGEVRAHREWMARSFAIGLGIATIRLMALTVLNATSLTARQIITPVFWLGWALTLLLAELWIRAQQGSSEAAPASTDSAPRAA